jgi:hypothetical protein
MVLLVMMAMMIAAHRMVTKLHLTLPHLMVIKPQRLTNTKHLTMDTKLHLMVIKLPLTLPHLMVIKLQLLTNT